MATMEEMVYPSPILANDSTATAEPEITAFNDEAVTEPQPVKRGRGRPRKVPGETSIPQQGPKTTGSLKAEVPMPKPGVLAEGVANVYVFAGMGLATMRPQTGMALAANAEECGKAWEALAAQNPAVRKALLSILQTSTWGALIGAHIPIVMMAVQEGQQIAAVKREQKEDANAAVAEAANAPVFPFVPRNGGPAHS